MRSIIAGVLFLIFLTANSAIAVPYTGADITLDGDEYTNISGEGGSADNTWFVLEDSIYTAWANNWVEYTVYLEAGNWNIGLNAINHSSLGLPEGYLSFQVENDWVSVDLLIPASDTEENFGLFNYIISSADNYTIRYVWLNDSYSAGVYDANIEITSVFFDNTETAPVPEPATLLLFGTGLIGLAAGSRKKFLKK